MSVLFPKVNKAPTWNYRPIYYDPKKDEMDRKLAALQAKREAEAKAGDEQPTEGGKKPYTPTLHKGSFREMHDVGRSSYTAKEESRSKLVMWVIILLGLLFVCYLLAIM